MASPSRGRSGKTEYQIGEKVMALWPGSSMYYPATVQDIAGGKFTVLFENNSTATVTDKGIFKANRRTRSRSRSRSPARRRSRSRSRSPGRPRKQASTSPSRSTSTPLLTPRKARPDTPVRRSLRIKAAGEDASSKNLSEETFKGVLATQVKNTSLALEITGKAVTLQERANFEFMGPTGVVFMMLGLPATVLGLYLACNKQTCSIRDVSKLRLPSASDLWDVQSFLVVMAWLAFIAGLSLIPVGRIVYGRTLQNGTKLAYRLNGFFVFIVCAVVFAVGSTRVGLQIGFQLPLDWVYDHYLHLAMASGLISLMMAVGVYLYSFRDGAILASGGNTGNHVYDFFVGRELNPRVGQFDLKFFCELRPGLIAWVLINFCMMYKQFELHDQVSNSMILVCLFQFIYVLDGLYSEEAILSTMDIVHDGFGFMLAYGDLGWVPFVYTLQARYLVDTPVHLPGWAVALLLLSNMLGFAIFRLANGQKDQFRANPHSANMQHLRTIPTSSGKALLADGWWGMCRHPNYLGDLLMGFSWCAVCGIQHIIPYFYIIYFTILLVHRQRRDDIHCQRKYGSAWEEYERTVPYRIVPGIY